MKNIVLLLLISIFACSSCDVKEKPVQDNTKEQSNTADQTMGNPVQEEPFDFEAFFAGVDTINACVAVNEGFSGLNTRLDRGIQAPINKINSSSVLKELFYQAHKKQIAAGPKKEVRCSDKNAVVIDRTLKRLGNLKNDASTQVLIELYKDTTLAFIGNDAKTLARAMSRGGDKMLELLEPIKDQRPRLGQRIITSLKSGKPLY